MPSAAHSALRLALQSMLQDLTYPEAWKARPWVEARLKEVSWEETLCDRLRPLAIRWAQQQSIDTARALRRALGEEIARDPVPVLRNRQPLPVRIHQ